MAQKLHEMANARPGEFEAAQHEFNNGQMLPRQTGSRSRRRSNSSKFSRRKKEG
jgi:hypothetical protein